MARNSKSNMTAPRKKPKRSKTAKKAFDDRCEKQIAHVEMVANGDQMILHIEKFPSGHGFFFTPLVNSTKEESFDLFSEKQFNCHSTTNHCLRKNSEENAKVNVGKLASKGYMHKQTAILAEPSNQMLNKQGQCNIELEQEFRDICVEYLKEHSKTSFFHGR